MRNGNQGSFLDTLLNYGGAAVGFGPDDAARLEQNRLVAERKGHNRVYPYFKLDNPIMYQSSQYNIRPQTSGVRDTLSNGGILTGGADIDQNDDGFSYTTSQKSLKSSTIRVSTAGRSIKTRR